MSSELIGIFGLLFLVLMLIAGVHIGVALGLVGVVGIASIRGFGVGLASAAIVPHVTVGSYDLAIIPLFLLMGEFAIKGGGVADMFQAAKVWFGRMPGGTALTTLAVSTGLAATTGSTVAATAMMTRVALPELVDQGYSKGQACGIIASCGTLAVLIPPSVFLVYYAIATLQSVGGLLLAGFIPGFVMSGAFFVYIALHARFSPSIKAVKETATWRLRVRSLTQAWAFIVIIAVIFGGLYGGIFSPTEVGAAGCLITFVLMLTKRQLNIHNVIEAARSALSSSCMVAIILVGAYLFSRFLALSGLSAMLTEFIVGLAISVWVKFAIIVVSFVVLGCFLESFAMLALTLPLYFPAIVDMGFDPVWFGVISVLMVQIGGITPPFGLTVYVAKGIAGPDVELMDAFRGALPFVILQLCNVVILSLFPMLALFLPTRVLG